MLGAEVLVCIGKVNYWGGLAMGAFFGIPGAFPVAPGFLWAGERRNMLVVDNFHFLAFLD